MTKVIICVWECSSLSYEWLCGHRWEMWRKRAEGHLWCYHTKCLVTPLSNKEACGFRDGGSCEAHVCWQHCWEVGFLPAIFRVPHPCIPLGDLNERNLSFREMQSLRKSILIRSTKGKYLALIGLSLGTWLNNSIAKEKHVCIQIGLNKPAVGPREEDDTQASLADHRGLETLRMPISTSIQYKICKCPMNIIPHTSKQS